jgi:cytochrome c oxidase subunit II
MFDLFKNMPEAISSFAPDIDSLLMLIYVLTGIFFVGLEGYMVYLVFRYRYKKGVAAKYEPGSKAQIQWILAFTVVMLLLDLFIDYKGAHIWSMVKEEMPACDMTIKVQAKQFDWTFFYPDKDGNFGPNAISSYRELHVPVGKKIHVILTSLDVIHDFFLPEVRLKQDVMPQRFINQWFDTQKVGTYHIVCDELCGFGHTRMTAVLHVDDQKTFDDWLASKEKEQQGGTAQ